MRLRRRRHHPVRRFATDALVAVVTVLRLARLLVRHWRAAAQR